MLIYAKTGCVDGYCLVPPQFSLENLDSYNLCAGRDDGLLMYLEKSHSFDEEKYIKLSKRDVDVVQIVPIEESDPETTLLVSSSSEPVECPEEYSRRCLVPLPNRFCPPWEQTDEVQKQNWRCFRLLLSVHQAIPVVVVKKRTEKKKKVEERKFERKREKIEK